MSELRIALVAEGGTDWVIVNSALQAILPSSFVLTLLQPESTRPDLGGGWGGVLKWCREFRSRGFGMLEEDPTLELYDFFIIQIDADVADFSYADIQAELIETAQQEGWGVLPCPHRCPPPEGAVDNLKRVLYSWFGTIAIGNKTVLCIPSKSSEAWLAAAVRPNNARLMAGIECSTNMEGRLAALPKGERIKKQVKEYRNHSATIKSAWPSVRARCSRAEVFHLDITAVLRCLSDGE